MAKKDFHNWSKEKLLHEYKELLKRKKFGIVWEDKPEDVAEQCKTSLPVLKEEKKRDISSDQSGVTHIMIESDNYHALSVLNYTHKRKVDVIYIDPPYNTGNKSWMYNNHYIDKDDRFRHSKWLSFMSKRLRLAKNLLKSESGVLICTIDDNENAALALLLQELFPSYEIVGVVIIHNPAGIQGKNFSYTHEFAYFVYPQNRKCIGTTARDKDLISPLRDWGGTSSRKLAKNCFFPIIIKNEEIVGFGEVCSQDFHPKSSNVKQKKGTIYVYPIDKHGVEKKWVYSRNSAEKNLDQLFVKIIDGEYVIMRKKSAFTYRTVWDDKRYYANIYGSKLLNSIIPDKFPFPKSLYAVEDCIKAVIHDKNNAVILDFFAGSGTTGHAVLELNKKDGGSRQFILCTNNENNNGNGTGGIAESVCYPRIKKVIEGYKDPAGNSIAGLGGNLRYYSSELVGNIKTDNDKRILTSRSTEMLCLAEATFDEVANKKGMFAIYENQKQMTGIIFDEDAITDFKKEARKHKKSFVVYVFSYDHTYNEEDFEDMNNLKIVKPIPEVILNVYRKIYKELYKPRNL